MVSLQPQQWWVPRQCSRSPAQALRCELRCTRHTSTTTPPPPPSPPHHCRCTRSGEATTFCHPEGSIASHHTRKLNRIPAPPQHRPLLFHAESNRRLSLWSYRPPSDLPFTDPDAAAATWRRLVLSTSRPSQSFRTYSPFSTFSTSSPSHHILPALISRWCLQPRVSAPRRAYFSMSSPTLTGTGNTSVR